MKWRREFNFYASCIDRISEFKVHHISDKFMTRYEELRELIEQREMDLCRDFWLIHSELPFEILF